jgi:hypothetical protein
MILIITIIMIKVLKYEFEYACREVLHNTYAVYGRICRYICGSTYAFCIVKIDI